MNGKAPEASVRVAGRVRHLRLDHNALCSVEQITGVNLAGSNVVPTLSVLRAMCYAALMSGARAHGGPRDFDLEDVGDWMHEEPELLDAVTRMLAPAMPDPAVEGQDAADPQPVEGRAPE